jgi:hypothetical protein
MFSSIKKKILKPNFKKRVNIIVLPKKHTQFKPLSIFHRHRRKYQLFAAVAVVYTIIGGLLGYAVITSPTKVPASASTPARITPSIRFMNQPEGESHYNLNDNVLFAVTLQNSSPEDSANEVSLSIKSTNEALRIVNIRSVVEKSYSYSVAPDEKNISILAISAGSQAEYIIDSVFTKNDMENLNIEAEVSYKNRDTVQTTNSNFLSTTITQSTRQNTNLVFQPMAAVFQPKESVKLTLNNPHLKKNFGKIYLSNRTTAEPTTTSECDFDGAVHTSCEAEFKNLSPGNYSALYISEDEKQTSNISWFSVNTQSTSFQPSQQTILESVFGKNSVNGVFPVIARKVLSLNQNVNTTQTCTFEVYFNDKKVAAAQTNVNEDRDCYTQLDSGHFNQGNGVYRVKLVDFETPLDVSYTEKSKTLFTATITGSVIKNKPVDIEVKGLNDTNNQPLTGKKATLGLWHVPSHSFQELNSVNNQQLNVTDGVIGLTLPYSYIDKGGLYQAILKLEDGTQSDWLSINLTESSVAFSKQNISQNGILSDVDLVRAGDTVTFTLGSLLDKDSNSVTSGNCATSIYTGNLTPVLATGTIEKGICSINVKAGRLTKAGPALVSFTSPEIPNPINQSKHITITAGNPTTFPNLNLETFPAQSQTANTLIIGPVTDNFGNLASGEEYTVEVLKDDESIKTIEHISITDGFARVTLPASLIDGQKITTRLINTDLKELIKTDFPVSSDTPQFTLPNLPDTINNDKNIKIEASQSSFVENTVCRLRIIRSLDRNNETATDLLPDTKACTFDWDVQENRDTKSTLLQYIIGNQMVSKIVTNESGSANNLFAITPQIRFMDSGELDLTLLTSPLIDRQGLPVESAPLKWKYNGKLRDSTIEKGVSSVSIIASDLNNRDIQSTNNQRFLSLDLDIKASSSSINKTNNLNLYLGNRDLNNKKSIVTPLNTSNTLSPASISISRTKFTVDPENIEQENQTIETTVTNLPSLFSFKSDTCIASNTDAQLTTTPLNSHLQGGICYVELSNAIGGHRLTLSQSGFSVFKHNYAVTKQSPLVSICENEKGSCVVQVKGDQTSTIITTIRDGDKVYRDESKGADNNLTVVHTDLSPIKKYTVEVSFTGKNGQKINVTKEVSGQLLNQ